MELILKVFDLRRMEVTLTSKVTFVECKLCKWHFHKLSNPKTGICQYCEAYKVINGGYPVGAYSHHGEIHNDVPKESLMEFVDSIRQATKALEDKEEEE